MKKRTELARRALSDVLGNPGLFALASLAVTGMFTVWPLSGYRGMLELSVLLPWGLALALLGLDRRVSNGDALRFDLLVLAALFVWLVVPFWLRFGFNATTLNTWQNHAAVFFGIYALAAHASSTRLERQLDTTLALGVLLTLAFCGALLYCGLVGIGGDTFEVYPFGVYIRQHLTNAAHYNTTGILSLCLSLICVTAACRAKCRIARALSVLAAAMASVVVVLTQSRTSRYCLLFALALGAYGAVAMGKWNARALKRHAAGALAGLIVLAGGYVAAGKITDAALAHFARVRTGVQTVSLLPAAIAEEGALTAMPDTPDVQTEPEVQAEEARTAGDSTFSGRTALWGNIFSFWKQNPKYLLIGNGVGRSSRDLLIGTPLENVGANMAHNTYIQFVLDHGLIGFALMALFLVWVAVPVLRVFFSAEAMPGSRALCMMAAAILVLGLMESEPLGALRPSNVMLFYALGCLVGADKRLGGKR